MSDIAFLLGPVVLRDFEATAGIDFGGEQRLVVHKLPGGGRVIDALGRDDCEITLSGTFSGSDATLRARLVDELRVSGATLPLTWDVFFYSVVIRDFRADYQNNYWIPYRLTCTVLRDEASGLLETAASLAESVISDLGMAASQALSGIDFGGAQSAAVLPGSMTLGTTAYSQAAGALGTAQSNIDAGLFSVGSSLDQASAELATTTDASAGAAALGSAASNSGRLGSLAVARSYVGRAAINLANAST